MLGKKSVLNSLEAQRQALVMESDRNRAELAREWAELKQEAVRVVTPARKAGHYFSMGMKAVGAFMALRRVWSQTQHADGRRNWMATLLQAARIGVSLWPAFRSPVR
jgi:hypothetical protein